MTVPLRHFVVALGFLVVGVPVGLVAGRTGHLAQIHLLLAGFVCLTIMGAMTQFVPVWSGVELHSRRLAAGQLPLAAVGFAGLAGGFATGVPAVLPVAGILAVLGVLVFVYNLGRTLRAAQWDVTTVHFALALGFFVALAGAGLALALDRSVGLLPVAGVGRFDLVMAHATLAVFGVVLTTVAGALAQLAPMFTQAPDSRISDALQRAETGGYPVGVALLTTGRLLDVAVVARVGGLLVAAGLGAVAAILARRLGSARTEWTPMLTRYAAVAVALGLWTPLAGRAWLAAPLDYGLLFGGPAPGRLLLAGGIGFVVLGTLYHVVPFIVWVHRYSDRLGFEDVPMIDDLYDGRVAAADGVLFAVAAVLFVGHAAGIRPATTGPLAGLVAGAASLLFAGNILSVLVHHSPDSIRTIIAGRIARGE